MFSASSLLAQTPDIKELIRSAKAGNAEAQCYIGLCYEESTGVAQDYTKAAELFQDAAVQDHAWAQCYLGLCYELGHGVSQNYADAYYWYQKATAKGVDFAEIICGDAAFRAQAANAKCFLPAKIDQLSSKPESKSVKK